jgi:hypothetical protein
VGLAEAASAGMGKAVGKAGRMRGLVQSGAGAAGARHMAGRAAAARRVEEQRREREVDEGGPD